MNYSQKYQPTYSGSRINRSDNVISTAGIFISPHEQDRIKDNIIENSKLYTNHFFDQSNQSNQSIPIDLESIHNLRRDNTQAKSTIDDIYSQTYTSYINIASNCRTRCATILHDSKIYNLDPHPIEFTHGSEKIKIFIPNHNFRPGQLISLNNIISKNLILNGVVSIKNNSLYFRINHINHGLSLFGLYAEFDSNEFEPVHYVDDFNFNSEFNSDPIQKLIPDSKQYYIWKKNHLIDLSIWLDGIIDENNQSDMIGNIPINYLNKQHLVYILFTKNQTKFEPVRSAYIIKLGRKSNINYRDGSNSIYIKYNNLFGIPLNCLNSGPESNFSIWSTSPDAIKIDVKFKAIVDPIEPFYNLTDNLNLSPDRPSVGYNWGGGTESYIRLINELTIGYPNPNDYLIILDKVYRNVITARIISSTFPNSQMTINNSNNRLYWKNLDDGNHVYSITIDRGNYSSEQLKIKLENLFNRTIRYPYRDSSLGKYDINGILKYHLVKVDPNPETNIIGLSAYKQIFRKNLSNSIMTVVYDRVKFVLDPNIHICDSDIVFIYAKNSCGLIYLYNRICSQIETNRSVLINFYRRELGADGAVRQEIKSINTKTILNKFTFNDIFHTLHLINHQLNISDLIITDQFIPSELLIFEIVSVINSDTIKIKKCDYKFIYDQILINFESHSPPNVIIDILPDLTSGAHINIYHLNHNLDVGVNIQINSDPFIVTRIIDMDHYEVYNEFLLDVMPDTVCITYPDIFQLCFDYPDSMNEILGWNRGSVTPYSHLIQCEYCPNAHKSDYFYIKCLELNTGIEYYRNTGEVSDVFAQVRWWYNDYHGISFDSFVPTIKILNPPIDILTQLHIQIVHPDGRLVDLNGADHSFTIEITEVFNQPTDTDISARINSEIISRRV